MPSHDYLPHSQSHLDEMRKEEQEYEEYYEATNHLRWYGKAPSFTEWKRNEIEQKQLKEEIHKYYREYEEDDDFTKQLVKECRESDAKIKELPKDVINGMAENTVYPAIYWDVTKIEDCLFKVFVYSEVCPKILFFNSDSLLHIREDKKVFYFKLNEEQKRILDSL